MLAPMPPAEDPAPQKSPTGATGADARNHYRAPIRLRVDYERMNTFFADYTKNISKGGTFIKTSKPLGIGTKFVFALAIPALSEPVTLQGEVAWVMSPESATRQPGEEPGMGIRFLFEEEGSRARFEELVERMMEESLGPAVTSGLLRK